MIEQHLCYHDDRNPDNNPFYSYGKTKNCSCDNCFYGKTELAELILKLKKENDELRKSIKESKTS